MDVVSTLGDLGSLAAMEQGDENFGPSNDSHEVVYVF